MSFILVTTITWLFCIIAWRNNFRFGILPLCGSEKILVVFLAVISVLIELHKYKQIPYAVGIYTNGVAIFLSGIIINAACGIVFSYVWVDVVNLLRRIFAISIVVVCLLPASPAKEYYYESNLRHTGIFEDPNTFGLLCVIAILISLQYLVHVLAKPAGSRDSGIIKKIVTGAVVIYLVMLLAKSYSRGSWLSLIVAIIYGYTTDLRVVGVFSHVTNFVRSLSKSTKWKVIVLLTFFGLVYSCQSSGLWSRLATVCNPDDYSWSNRVRAWTLGIQMITDRPFTGFGWANAGVYYSGFYLPSYLIDHQAVYLNSFILLGITTGAMLPTVIAFYVIRVLRHRPKFRESNTDFSITRVAVCAISIGMLFDGGILIWISSIVFWVLLAMAEHEIELCII